MTTLPMITLRHLMLDGQPFIGMQFHPNKVVEALIATLADVTWSDEYRMHHVPNTADNLTTLFRTFKGVAWLEGRYFFRNRPVHPNAEPVDMSA